jgi:hypothetical protein
MRWTGPAALAAALGAASPAAAVVGGREEAGPLRERTVMVLASGGGVCSAVVVAPDAVLTAAHCVPASAEHRVHWRGEDGSPVLVEPAARAVHPGYDPGAVAGRRRSIDLALLRLAQPLPARFRPADLREVPASAGATVLLAAYGTTRAGDPRSSGTFRSAELTVVEPYGPSRILLWAKAEPGTGACQGDSGGPIAAGDAVVAVVSWATGPNGRGCGGITQGILVGPQRAWIDATLGSWGASARWR